MARHPRIPRIERPCGICGAVIFVRADEAERGLGLWCSPEHRGEGRARENQARRLAEQSAKITPVRRPAPQPAAKPKEGWPHAA